MKLLQTRDAVDEAGTLPVINLANDADPLELADRLHDIQRVNLHFPKFSDGRAFSQAWLLRRRMHYSGAIRANGDVLVDQLAQMKRSGFSEAMLRDDQDAELGERLMRQFDDYYQGDAVRPAPRFAHLGK